MPTHLAASAGHLIQILANQGRFWRLATSNSARLASKIGLESPFRCVIQVGMYFILSPLPSLSCGQMDRRREM